MFIQDINTGRYWHCLYNDWISVEHGSGDLCVEVPSLTPEEIHKKRLYQTMLRTSQGLRNGHIWLSIALKPSYRYWPDRRLSFIFFFFLSFFLSVIIIFFILMVIIINISIIIDSKHCYYYYYSTQSTTFLKKIFLVVMAFSSMRGFWVRFYELFPSLLFFSFFFEGVGGGGGGGSRTPITLFRLG